MGFGLLGEKLQHSYSPQIHELLADYPYELFEVAPDDLSAFLRKDHFHGINVTIPYKKAVIPYCNHLTPQAQRLGAVNTIIRQPDGSLLGHNTDYYGFTYLLKSNGIELSGKKVVVLGSGGAANTVKAVLDDQKAETVIISRSGSNNYDNIHLHKDASILVNTTPVGMYPHNGATPVDLNIFTSLTCVIDLIYNPYRTKLLLDAEERGIKAINGLTMLVAQAKESSEWFTGTKIAENDISPIVQKLSAQMENIVLIGMPGCGKTTLGKALAVKLDREFVDTDTYIAVKTGMTCSQIIQTQGEKAFRKLESEALSEICKRSSLIIATGGGCVTEQENYPLLHQNSKILWIQRQTHHLPVNDRPISQACNLNDLYETRKPLYSAFADISINNNATEELALQAIMAAIKETAK